MTKTRFTAADVRAMVRDLRASVHGLRVVNVYDLDAKTYLFKLASPGQEKAVLLLESGVRFHTTKFTHTKSDMPSGFSMKLRKHVRTQRLEDVRQVGMDRVVDFKFGSGEASHHVILELYAQGNIILTDHKYEILDLLRTHTYDGQGDDDANVRVAVRQIYPMDLATSQEGTQSTSTETAPAETIVAETDGAFAKDMPVDVATQRMGEWLQRAAEAAAEPSVPTPAFAPVAAVPGGDAPLDEVTTTAGGRKKGGGGGGARKAKKATLKQVLMQKGSGVSVYGPSVIEHCVLGAGLRPNAKLSAGVGGGEIDAGAVEPGEAEAHRGGFSAEEVRRLVVALGGAEAAVQQLDRPGQQGYIQCKPLAKKSVAGKSAAAGNDDKVETEADGSGGSEGNDKKDDVVYEDFLPQLLAQHEGALVHAFPSFDQAVDAFFGRIVEQKLKQTALAAEAAVERKVALIRQDQEKRALALEERQEKMLQHAQLAEAWADDVEKALMVVRSALANGMNWQDLDELVQAETANGNPIASLIHELRLDRNKVVLALPTSNGDEQLVEVDVMLSAHANARVMYENKKIARNKELKTLKASEKVLKIAEQQAQKALQQQQHKRSLQVARKTFWFEKFNWFITSENYLVLSGRDAQQNEVVVKKYLRPGDIYVHADLHGASSCVVRNKDPSGKRPVSPLALEEAGCMTVCRSGAWGAKMVTSAWWVYADQVSKTAPTGEYLVTGSFMVRGRKHFLPPRSLEMGFALLFRLDDSCLAAHAGERREKGTGEEEAGFSLGGGGAVSGSGAGTGSREAGENRKPLGSEYGFTGRGRSEDDNERGIRFDAPVGLHENRSGLDEEAARRRAAALAALAGVGQGSGKAETSAEKAKQEEGEKESWAGFGGEAPKKRLSAKERKLAKKGGAGYEAKASKAEGNGDNGNSGSNGKDGVDGSDTRHVGRAGGGDEGQPGAGVDAANGSSVPRGKKGKLKKMKKKYAEQDEDDRKLAMEALGKVKPDGDSAGGAVGKPVRGKRHEGDRKEAAAAAAAAEAAASRNQAKVEAERTAALSALEENVRDRLEGLVQPDELDAFEIRALGRFDRTDAMDILDRFAEADLRKVRNRSGFLAGIMRKHGAASTSAVTPSSQTADKPPFDSSIPASVAVATVEGTMSNTLATMPPPPPNTAADTAPSEDATRILGTGVDEIAGVNSAAAGGETLDANPGSLDGAATDKGDDDDDSLEQAVLTTETSETNEGSTSAAVPSDDEQENGEERPGLTSTGEKGCVDGETDGEPLSRRAQKRREEEEVRKLLEEEGGEDLDGDGDARGGPAAAVSELDKLTGKPRDEDVLLFAVPVCGPYMSLRDYRYKVKLTPGKQKRGKASKQAIEVFSRGKDTPPAQKALMKGVTDNECVQAMIGDVKVSVAGLAQATQAKKKANKQQAQKDPGRSSKQQQAKGKGGKSKKK